jgi:integrase
MAEKLTKTRIREAVEAGKVADLRDAQAPGLTLRVWGQGKWAWNVRRTVWKKDYREDLGSDWSLEDAREIANEYDRRIRQKVDPFGEPGDRRDMQLWIAEKRSRRDGGPVVVPVQRPRDTGPKMTWAEGKALWLAEVRRTRREETAAGYDRALRVAELRIFETRLAKEIERTELAEAVTKIAGRGKERQAQVSTIAIRQMFSFLGSDGQRRASGVTEGAVERLKAPPITLCEDDELDGSMTVPVGRDIGRIASALRNPDSTDLERDRLAGLLLLYTVQRRSPVANARVADFTAAEGGGVWSMGAPHRKTASVKRRRHGVSIGRHDVPLPPAAWAVVERAKELAGDSEWLFPALRDRRAGTVALHMPPSSLTHLYGRIVGNACTPHDMRRAFGTTWAATLSVSRDEAKGAVKEILDHNEGHERDVTSEHYMLLTGDGRKWKTMRSWAAWVDAQAAEFRGP